MHFDKLEDADFKYAIVFLKFWPQNTEGAFKVPSVFSTLDELNFNGFKYILYFKSTPSNVSKFKVSNLGQKMPYLWAVNWKSNYHIWNQVSRSFQNFFFWKKNSQIWEQKRRVRVFFWEILKVMVILKSPILIYLSSKFLWKIKIPLNSRAKLHNMGFFSLQIEKNYYDVWNQLLEIGQKSISNLCNEFLPRVWLFLRSRIHLF